jgi:hypothetical protein
VDGEWLLIADAPPSITLWLSILLGAYLIAGGIGALLRGDLWPEMIGEFERSPALVAVTGAVAFSVGAIIVSIHNVWTDPAAIIVSAAGWMAIAEGLVLLAVPSLWLRLALPMMRASKVWGAGMLLLGAFLLSSALVQPLAPTP